MNVFVLYTWIQTSVRMVRKSLAINYDLTLPIVGVQQRYTMFLIHGRYSTLSAGKHSISGGAHTTPRSIRSKVDGAHSFDGVGGAIECRAGAGNQLKMD